MLSFLAASLMHHFFPFRFFLNAKNYRVIVHHMSWQLLASMSLLTPESAKEKKNHIVCSENMFKNWNENRQKSMFFNISVVIVTHGRHTNNNICW